MSLSILVNNAVKVGGVVTSLSKAIPVEKIDALISEAIKHIEKTLTWNLDVNEQRWELASALETLRGLEKESVEMIPLSTVEALIKKAEQQMPKTKSDQWNSWDVATCNLIYHLKSLIPAADKEIPIEKMIPVSVIEERIKQLKENLKTAKGAETFDIDSRIDELQDLILE